jgi:hypothetical protein
VSVAAAASTLYECEVQSSTGALGSILESVRLIGIDEAEQAIDFFAQDDRPHHTMGRLADLSFFHSDLATVTGAVNTIDRVEAFALHLNDETSWLATHSFTLSDGVAAVTWECQLQK